jgi:hypothetical protein
MAAPELVDVTSTILLVNSCFRDRSDWLVFALHFIDPEWPQSLQLRGFGSYGVKLKCKTE